MQGDQPEDFTLVIPSGLGTPMPKMWINQQLATVLLPAARFALVERNEAGKEAPRVDSNAVADSSSIL